MASPTQKPRKNPAVAHKPSSRLASVSADLQEPVDPIWLVKAFALTVLAALVCGYLSLCLLFYQGQWQLVLHPARSTSAPATIAGTPIQIIRFGVDESATPQLNGSWIPAEPLAKYAAYTVLYLPSGDGSLADAQPTLAALHTLGINVFAFDYRGYGQSAEVHPNQQRMAQDANLAWNYLTVSRSVSRDRVVLFGNGAGGYLAARLAAEHPEVRALIIDSPRPDFEDIVLSDPRVKWLPARILFHDRFDITQSVSSLATPKLIVFRDIHSQPAPPSPVLPTSRQLQVLADAASAPKVFAHLESSNTGSLYSLEISRFLDEYLH